MKPCLTWTLRDACEADEIFLRTLYASTRLEEEPIRRWPPAHKTRFLAMQYEAQDKHYRGKYPDAERWIIRIIDKDTGRLILNRTGDDIRIVDISLLPAFRGKGMGSSIIRKIIEEADALGASVSLSVAMDNPARRLYQRLGFKECPGGTPPYLQMKRDAAKESKD